MRFSERAQRLLREAHGVDPVDAPLTPQPPSNASSVVFDSSHNRLWSVNQDNGSVSVVVQRLGPDTNVRTSTAGNLFKDVVLRRGQTMAPAGG